MSIPTFAFDYFKAANTDTCLLFCHGIKGAKDWGAWHKMAEYLVDTLKISVVTMNFSYNGISKNSKTSFDEPEKFGQNNYTKELNDIHEMESYLRSIGYSTIYLMGHSRGGGISLIYAALYQSVQKVIGLAPVHRLDYAWLAPGFVEKWKDDGVYQVYNSREKIYLPTYYQFFEDFELNKEKYDIQKVAPALADIPSLLVHGTEDSAIAYSDVVKLSQSIPSSVLIGLKGAGHTFGISHPWEKDAFSDDFQKALDLIVSFIREEQLPASNY